MMKRILLLCLSLACVGLQAKTRKAVFVIIDGVPADRIEQLRPPTLMSIAKAGHYSRAYCGGDVGCYNETRTISAVGYTNILTGTWFNKHNVKGNSNIEENYSYPTVFRIAKDQPRSVSTALFSSWTDNRTILLGEGREETRCLKIDYVCDGYDNDTLAYPHVPGDLHLRDIDGRVCDEAAKCIAANAPDLSWIYLWYTDDAYHQYGYGKFTDEAVLNADRQLAPVWDAIQKRQKETDEEWLVIVTTDHGRDVWGRSHGRQSQSERTVWMICNQKKLNRQFFRPTLSHVDIAPTICRWMGFERMEEIQTEMDGIPFVGKTDIYGLRAEPYDREVTLRWQHEGPNATAQIFVATTNDFARGKSDKWTKAGETDAKNKEFRLNLDDYGRSDFYKFLVCTPSTTLNCWLKK